MRIFKINIYNLILNKNTDKIFTNKLKFYYLYEFKP